MGKSEKEMVVGSVIIMMTVMFVCFFPWPFAICL